MALIKCYECKAKISTEAASCPHCGAPKKVELPAANPEKKTSPITWTVLVLIILFVFVAMSAPNQDASSSLTPEQIKEREKQLVEKVLKVPATDVDENIRLYRKLHDLNPDSARYRDKLAHYRGKREELERQAAAKEKVAGYQRTICETTGYLIKEHYMYLAERLDKSDRCEFFDTDTYVGPLRVRGYVDNLENGERIWYTAEVSYSPSSDVVTLRDVEFEGSLKQFLLAR